MSDPRFAAAGTGDMFLMVKGAKGGVIKGEAQDDSHKAEIDIVSWSWGMSEISRAALFSKLNRLAYKAVEGATVFCKLRGNPYVELVHWVHQLLQTPDSDLHRVIKHFELNTGRLASDVTDALDRLPRGATSISDLSSHVENAVERGWVYATLMFGESQVRSGHLMVGILKTPSLRNALMAISRQFEGIKLDTLTEDFTRIVNGSPEDALASSAAPLAAPGEASDAMAPAQMGKQEALKRFATDLTEKARKGQIDPVSGRDEEIRQIVDILMSSTIERRRWTTTRRSRLA